MVVTPHYHDPNTEYQRRLEVAQAIVSRDTLLDSRLATARGMVFLVGLFLVYAASGAKWLSADWVAVALAIFVALVVIHARVIRQVRRSSRAVAYYETAIRRVNDRWSGCGPTGARYLKAEHPYASDLDIFGDGSLFQLLSTARTRLGEDTLAAWLLQPAKIDVIQRRQIAVAELQDRLDFREELALLDAAVHEELDQNRLLNWSREPRQVVSPARRISAVVLAFAALAGLIAWLAGAGVTPLMLVLIGEAVFIFTFRKQLQHTAATVSQAGSGLALLSQVLEIIEREKFDSPELARLRATLDIEGLPPSRRIAQLNGLIQYLTNTLENQFFAPLAFALCLHVHLLHAIERWKERCGPSIVRWLEAVGEIEALSSFAGLAYERPTAVYPQLTDETACFEAVGLGHPLLPKADCIANDIALVEPLRLIMISGSNMSGKSTFLRAVGTNAVLALAGAPVLATSLRLSPVLVGTTMRAFDSLQEGASLFYRSVSRLKSIVEMAGQDIPLLFLFDEILQGTNSHDRRVGAEAIISNLVNQNALGLVTTHDLALTEMVPLFGDRAINVHFEDQIVEGKMSFDYRLRPGVVKKSNALELMRMVGLKVDPDITELPDPESTTPSNNR